MSWEQFVISVNRTMSNLPNIYGVVDDLPSQLSCTLFFFQFRIYYSQKINHNNHRTNQDYILQLPKEGTAV
jgi:hypothetical protein